MCFKVQINKPLDSLCWVTICGDNWASRVARLVYIWGGYRIGLLFKLCDVLRHLVQDCKKMFLGRQLVSVFPINYFL